MVLNALLVDDGAHVGGVAGSPTLSFAVRSATVRAPSRTRPHGRSRASRRSTSGPGSRRRGPHDAGRGGIEVRVASTTMASLPPISATTRLSQSWPFVDLRRRGSLMRRPTSREPVKATEAGARMGDEDSRRSRRPHPGESPRRRQTRLVQQTRTCARDGRRRPARLEDDGVAGDDGRGGHAARIASGKFHGGITTPTPRGRYRAARCAPQRCAAAAALRRRMASRA